MKQFHILIQGDIQGIGFRSWIKREAEKLHIVGWVKNREDGTVEAVVQGDGENVKKIIDLSKKGPEVAWVESVTVTENPINPDLLLFEVVY